MKRRNMCPNAKCEHYGRETHFMGGCHCGTALVPYKTVDEQINDTLTEIFAESHKRLGTYWMLSKFHDERNRS